jgi:putative endonuclease
MNAFILFTFVSKVDETIHSTGLTQSLEEPFHEHNLGACIHTRGNRPWRIEIAIAFKTKSKAVTFEQYLKSGSGREFARRHF